MPGPRESQSQRNPQPLCLIGSHATLPIKSRFLGKTGGAVGKGGVSVIAQVLYRRE